MKRRTFLKGALAVTASAAVPALAHSLTFPNKPIVPYIDLGNAPTFYVSTLSLQVLGAKFRVTLDDPHIVMGRGDTEAWRSTNKTPEIPNPCLSLLVTKDTVVTVETENRDSITFMPEWNEEDKKFKDVILLAALSLNEI